MPKQQYILTQIGCDSGDKNQDNLLKIQMISPSRGIINQSTIYNNKPGKPIEAIDNKAYITLTRVGSHPK
jgi:hypothetical protein